MAEIRSIGMDGEKIEVRLVIDKNEYGILKNQTTDLLLLPSANDALKYMLTTGRLGNSNRIMLPKKVLSAFDITEIEKKVAASIFSIKGDYFLLIKLKESDIGIPKFEKE
ncbi:MAG: hypothetical protein J7K54_00980 [Candidatus Aenigmarchaeota archaeon]|nr:hypothetical protein [Candidatus Aenigmarchaeota archaeon]